METTYNYFFSSTPQVLAGILGLFGVFIIFKINEIKEQVKVIKEELIDVFQNNVTYFTTFPSGTNKDEIRWKSKVEHLIVKKNFDKLYSEIDAIVNFTPNESSKKGFSNFQNRLLSIKETYMNLNKFKKELINRTIDASKITLITITYCLIMLILGKFISGSMLWSFIVFAIAIILTIYIFFKLISIIKYSFIDYEETQSRVNQATSLLTKLFLQLKRTTQSKTRQSPNQ